MDKLFLFFTVIAICSKVNAIELRGLNFLINFISGEFMDSKFGVKSREYDEPIITTASQSPYDFLSFITHENRRICYPYDMHLNSQANVGQESRKKEIKVECVADAGTGRVQMIDSLKDVSAVLSSHGNSTKRMVPGNCALIFFYTKSCPGSATAGPHFNVVARFFPDIRVAAVDSMKHHSLNTEFGIVGLPTIMLFHQGRPVVKFNETYLSFQSFKQFVEKYTGIKPLDLVVSSDDFKGPLSDKVEEDTDYCLYLAWVFIIVCSFYHFTKSTLFNQIVEMIKRNWRESEARHEVNN